MHVPLADGSSFEGMSQNYRLFFILKSTYDMLKVQDVQGSLILEGISHIYIICVYIYIYTCKYIDICTYNYMCIYIICKCIPASK